MARPRGKGTHVVSACIDQEQYQICVKKQQEGEGGWGWSALIKAGIGAKMRPTNLSQRLTELEMRLEAIKRQRDRVPEAIRKKFEPNDKIEVRQ